MNNKVYNDENGNYKFHFNDALDVFEPHSLSQKTTILADVDFVIEGKDKIILLEYKNASTKNADNPEAFIKKIKDDKSKVKFYENIAKKFYSTLFMIWACRMNDEKDIEYILLIEHPEIDGKIRRKLRNKISNQLPFKLAENQKIKRKIILDFEVLNIEDWHIKYPENKIEEV